MAGKEALASGDGRGARDHLVLPQQTWAGEIGSLGHKSKGLHSSYALIKTKRRGGEAGLAQGRMYQILPVRELQLKHKTTNMFSSVL